ncbi:ParA family protein [Desulfovibrio sulfodismutans]|uniref:ParA family protein n=1 Tax=Desulfolutivibrio sulfodismutans TaxID=63561 RepID=A0A7K3NGL3_9BACT|nr:ParA family protein [Desulfolutivibrio sulfodismutans]NDY55336.1 ParA family protein [Desulfolutivibrio sulfodismutans]QLA11038.1 AAA family ATPase [Desulfolutivibrio sulfodismutans DSM 3696]
MLKATQELNTIANSLSNYIDESKITDFRAILNFDMGANIYILCQETEQCSEIVKDLKKLTNMRLDIECISVEQFDDDAYYKSLFERTSRIDYGARRSLFSFSSNGSTTKKFKPWIVSFYSYKGGVGRTTSLALFGAHAAYNHGKKIFIIDLDIEAPGITNFYGLYRNGNFNNGVIEYLKDKEYDSSTALDETYVYEVSKDISGPGSIHVMSAGNIHEKNDRDDFIIGLARLDLIGSEAFINSIYNMISEIEDTYNPDIILIDSRTGLNDIFGSIVNHISSTTIGIFGIDVQNEPGLHFFLDTYIESSKIDSVILVNAIATRSFSKNLQIFKNKIDSYLNENLPSSIDSIPAIPTFQFSHNSTLECVGKDDEDLNDFIDVIVKKSTTDYVNCFEYLLKMAKDKTSSTPTSRSAHCEEAVEEPDEHLSVANNDSDENFSENSIINSADILFSKYPNKEAILNNLSKNYPEPYAEDICFSDDFLAKKFYIRKSMEDIFLPDKFMFLGGKGTGKTALYLALQNNTFFKNIKLRSQKLNTKYLRLEYTSLLTADGKLSDIFFSIDNFDQSSIPDKDYFYKRFWIVYIWAILFQPRNKLGITPSIPAFVIGNNAQTAVLIKKHIYDDQLFCSIENDLTSFDNYMNSQDSNLILAFDQLDKIVKPRLWSSAITPLINYCLSVNFKRLQLKLFIRRDLFNSLGNITNKYQLENRSINLEWSVDEIFDFFFKIIIAHSRDAFFNYISDYHHAYNRFTTSFINKMKKVVEKKHSYNQFNADSCFIKALVEVFFGEFADPDGSRKWGESYEWFYVNLKNADNTISLRPFLDLVKFALDRAKDDNNFNISYFPAINQRYFSAAARSYAVERHLKDLANEEGNEPLQIIINEIRNDKVPQNTRITTLLQTEFEELANYIIKNNKTLSDNGYTVEKFENDLTLNGIISVKYKAGGRKMYSFAFLYKYYLGLKKPMATKYKPRKFNSKY